MPPYMVEYNKNNSALSTLYPLTIGPYYIRCFYIFLSGLFSYQL